MKWHVHEVAFMRGIVTWAWRSMWILLIAVLLTYSCYRSICGVHGPLGYMVILSFSFALAGAFLCWEFGDWVFNAIRRGARKVLLSRNSSLHVFWTMTEQGLMLAQDVVRTDSAAKVEFRFFKEADMDLFKRKRLELLAESVDATWRFVDYGNLKISDAEGANHYFFGRDGESNLRFAQRLADVAKNISAREKTFYVQVEQSRDEEDALKWAEELCGRGVVNPVIMNESELVARQFAVDFSPLRHDGVKIDYETARIASGRCRTLLIGYDSIGKKIAEYLFASSKFTGESNAVVTFPITVVDKDAARFAQLELLGENVSDVITHFVMKLGSDAFEKWMVEHKDSFDRIVVNLPDDVACLRSAMYVRKLVGERSAAQMYVRVSDATVLAQAEAGVDFIPFGMVKSLYTRELVLNSHMDKLAKLVHATWSGIDWRAEPSAEDWRRIDRCWASADLYSRLSSLASALGAMNMLLLMGYECLSSDESIAKDDVVCSINREWASRNNVPRSVVEVLARNEHLRWCQYMLWSGFRTWNLHEPASLHDNEVREWIKANKSGKLPCHRLHAALVEYDRLPWLDSEMAKALGQRTENGEEPGVDYFEGKDEVALLSPNGETMHDTTMQGKDIRNVRDLYEKSVVAGMNEVKLKCWTQKSVGRLRDMAKEVYKNADARVLEGAVPESCFMKHATPLGRLRSGEDIFRLGRYECAFVHGSGMILPKFYVGGLLPRLLGFINLKQPRFVAQVQRIGDTVYVSFGGTACLRDWFENIKQFCGYVPSQFEMASELIRLVAKSTRARICVVGHSEGGGEVQYSLLKNVDLLRGRVNGYTFNSQRLSKRVVGQFDKGTIDQVEKVIVNYRKPRDVVSTRLLGKHLLGKVFDYHGDWSWNVADYLWGRFRLLKAHKLDGFGVNKTGT